MPEKTIIRKRKRDASAMTEELAVSTMDAMEVFRRHFESQFEPLKDVNVAEKKAGESEDENSNWDGFSGVSDENVDKGRGPEVIEFKATTNLTSDGQLRALKSELKSFMSSKPPSILPGFAKAASKEKKPGNSDDSDENPLSEAANLKNDLALQRLLRESHLLSFSSDTLEATGKNRLKAIESRIQVLGGKDLTGHKMPIKMRQGMNAGKKYRDKKRKREAKEAGIILEEVKVKKLEKKRNRGFGPSIGKFKRGALVLNRKDVREIEGGSGGKGGISGKGVKRKK